MRTTKLMQSGADQSQLTAPVYEYDTSIRMEFGVDKCAVMHVKRGGIMESEGLELSDFTKLRALSANDTYKYLGMSEGLGINGPDMKQSLRERFFGRLNKVLKSSLSGGNKVRAYNGWVMPVLMYSFGILKWTQTELDTLDASPNTADCKSYASPSFIDHECGGRGLLNAKTLHNRDVCNLREYFLKINEGMHREVAAVDNGFTPLSLAKENWRKPVVLSVNDRKEVWHSKELHGRFFRALHGPSVDFLASVSWLRFSNLFGETEGFVCAIMDEVILTNNYRKYIIKDGTVDICRACHSPVVVVWLMVAKIIHQQLALHCQLVEFEVPYYKYAPDPVLENGHITLYWDRSIITDRTIVANKPDIVVVDRQARRTMIINITIPHDENLVKAEKDKQIRYLDLAHEVVDMWNVDSALLC
uniref:SFRICE_018216 n=1 Tax=Spodoptera frugiperda TaxID=7108 RepID=A0A2H1WHZ3_SPOFR